VAICHNHDTVFRKTVQSLMELGWGNRVDEAKRRHGFAEIAHAWFTQMPRVDSLRDAAMVSALEQGFSHVLFLDADMVWPTDVLGAMLRHHDKGIVSALYFLKHAPYHPVALRNPRPRQDGSGVCEYEYDHQVFDVGPDGVRDEEAVGMGCTLVPTSALSALGPRPWFAYREDADGWPLVSEDVPFCEKARAAGIRIAVDPSIQCGHVTTQMATANFFRRVQQVHENGAAKREVVAEVTTFPREAAIG
jgi:GT2 family glycosyltransferase